MNLKQKFLKSVYPVFVKYASLVGMHNASVKNSSKTAPLTSIYELEVDSVKGGNRKLSDYKNMYILIVNTASYCGYTSQYAELEKLYKIYSDQLIVLAFPSNDFDEQEPEGDEKIAEFCDLNFKISFPLIKKTAVLPGKGQHPVFQWLTDPAKNGWNDKVPEWNFTKYLIDPTGKLVHIFESSISPLSKEVLNYLK